MNNPFETIDARLSNIESLLLDLKYPENNPNHPEPDQFMNLDQTCKMLNLAKQTVYSLVSRRQIPHTKKGKRLYFLKSEIDAWLSQGRRKTVEELQDEGPDKMREG